MSSSGSFAQFTTSDILRTLLENRATGKLRLSCGSHRKTIWFHQGAPVFATSTDPAEGLGEILVREGLLTTSQLREGLKRAPSICALGRTVVELGYVPAAELRRACRDQLTQIVLTLFTQESGTFVFEPAPEHPGDVPRIPLDTLELIREGARRMTEPRLLLRSVGSLEGILEKGSGAPVVPVPALDGRERKLLELLDGSQFSVRELCELAPWPAIETCRTLVSLLATGAARRLGS